MTTNSPTPMTDAEEFLTGWQASQRHKVVKSEVARQLETKLQSALREVEELKRDKVRLRWLWQHRNSATAIRSIENRDDDESYIEAIDNAMKEEK